MNLTKQLEILERQCPDDQMSLKGRITQSALARLTDEELETMMKMQEKSKINPDYIPSEEEGDAFQAYIHHLDAVGMEGSKASYASKS